MWGVTWGVLRKLWVCERGCIVGDGDGSDEGDGKRVRGTSRGAKKRSGLYEARTALIQ